MKKFLVFGTVALALGLGSCKTYCPAYNYAKLSSSQSAEKAPVYTAVTSPVSEKAI